jgi:hypothetical protein
VRHLSRPPTRFEKVSSVNQHLSLNLGLYLFKSFL